VSEAKGDSTPNPRTITLRVDEIHNLAERRITTFALAAIEPTNGAKWPEARRGLVWWDGVSGCWLLISSYAPQSG
jgi:hypothetical protein